MQIRIILRYGLIINMPKKKTCIRLFIYIYYKSYIGQPKTEFKKENLLEGEGYNQISEEHLQEHSQHHR